IIATCAPGLRSNGTNFFRLSVIERPVGAGLVSPAQRSLESSRRFHRRAQRRNSVGTDLRLPLKPALVEVDRGLERETVPAQEHLRHCVHLIVVGTVGKVHTLARSRPKALGM